MDQMISYYPFTMKYPKKVFFYLLEISMYNSFMIFKAKNSQTKLSLRSFPSKVIEKLCQLYHNYSSSSDEEKPPARAPRYDPTSRLMGGFDRHQLIEFPATEKKNLPQRRCRMCYKNGIRKDTKVYCKECRVPLCAKICFSAYHSRKSL